LSGLAMHSNRFINLGLAAGFLAVALVFVFHKRSGTTQVEAQSVTSSANDPVATAAPAATTQPAVTARKLETKEIAMAPVPNTFKESSAAQAASGEINPAEPSPTSPEGRQKAFIASRIEELQDLAMEDDDASLGVIVSELSNREPAIRQAAVEAAVQFGSRDAIPALLAAEQQAEDSHEKAAIRDAIEFLQLPKLTELQSPAKPADPRK
jgi:hypothetical protein